VTQLPPPPRGFNPSIPPSVEQIVLRCLAKNVDARFPTMQALREALLDPEAYLRASPPMSPARSLAPGEAKVDAKTVMAYAAQEQRTKLGVKTGPQAAMPLPAPPPSLPGNAGAKTMIADPSHAQQRPVAPQAPEMVAPAQPKMNTMRIATPLGYSSRPPRKMWPIVLVLALLLGLGGGAFAVAWFGRNDGASAQAGSADEAAGSQTQTQPAPQRQPEPQPQPQPQAGSGATAGSGASAGSGAAAGSAAAAGSGAATDTQPPGPAMAVIVIDSTPQGAEVIGPDGTSIGKTPATLSLPISDLPQSFELRLAGYKKETKQIVVTGNTVVNVALDRAPGGHPPRKGSGGGRKKGSGDDLINPADL
jgi:hypothetical protein